MVARELVPEASSNVTADIRLVLKEKTVLLVLSGVPKVGLKVGLMVGRYSPWQMWVVVEVQRKCLALLARPYCLAMRRWDRRNVRLRDVE